MNDFAGRASLPDALAQCARGAGWNTATFLYQTRDVLARLAPDRTQDLLDVGCANGLIDIVLSACCRSLLAVEPVAELAALARGNLAPFENVRVELGHAASVPAPDRSFDRVLMMEVVQYLAPSELPACFAELRRVTRVGGRIALISVPDGRKREEFLGPYLRSVREATHLSDDQKQGILARNESAAWYPPEHLTALWRALGCTATVHTLPPYHPQHDHRIDLLVTVND